MWVGLWMGIMSAWAAPPELKGVHLALVQDGIVEVALPGEVAQPETLPWRRPMRKDEYSRTKYVSGDQGWGAPITGLSHGGVRVGDTYTIRAMNDGAITKGCKVVSFVTRSVAYNQWPSDEDKTPACGTPQVYAQLDCTAKKPGLFLALRDGIKLGPYSKVAAEGRRPDRRAKATMTTPSIMTAVKKAHFNSEDPGSPMKFTYGVADLDNHPSLSVVDAHWFTGDAVVECGGGDFSSKRWAFWDGVRVVGEIRQDAHRPIALFTIGNQTFMVINKAWRGWSISDLEGNALYELHDGFCGCAC